MHRMKKAEKEDINLKAPSFLDLKEVHKKYLWSKENERFVKRDDDRDMEIGTYFVLRYCLRLY